MLQTLNIPAGGRQIDAKGTFFRYESAAAAGLDETIRVRADGNDLGTFLPGDYVELADPATRWNIEPVSGSLTGLVRVGMGRVGSSRLTGVVQVVDTSKATTLVGVAFSGSGSAAPGAAQFGSVQLWNPAGSGRRLIVEDLFVNAGATAFGYQIGLVAISYGASSGTLANRLHGGAASIAQIMSKTDHASDPSALLSAGPLAGAYLTVNSQGRYTPKRPIIVPPGAGLLTICRVANCSSSAQFDFYEETI